MRVITILAREIQDFLPDELWQSVAHLEEHTSQRKFVLIQRATEEVLVVGDINEHTMLHLFATLGLTQGLIEWIERTDCSSDAQDEWRENQCKVEKVIGAGKYDDRGRITSWQSYGYELMTPPAWQSPIRSAIERLVTSKQHI